MGFFAWIILGAIVGLIAGRLTDASDVVLLMLGLGVAGGVLGGWFATNVLTMGNANGGDLASIVVATLGAVAAVWIADAALARSALRRSAG